MRLIETAALERVMPWVHQNFLPEHLAGNRIDAAPPLRIGQTRDLLDGLGVDRQLSDLVARAAEFADKANRRAMAAIPGITPQSLGVGREEVTAFRQRNVRLIKTIGTEYLDDIAATLDGAAADLHVGEVTELLRERFGVSENRARFWARDQTLKLNAQLAEARATASGIEEYVWTGSLDEKERDMHRALEGQTFRYDDPPVTNEQGDRNNPGEDYQCRCTAFPKLPEYEVAADNPPEE